MELVGCDGVGIAVEDIAVRAFGALAELDTAAALEGATAGASVTVLFGAAGTAFEGDMSGKVV